MNACTTAHRIVKMRQPTWPRTAMLQLCGIHAMQAICAVHSQLASCEQHVTHSTSLNLGAVWGQSLWRRHTTPSENALGKQTSISMCRPSMHAFHMKVCSELLILRFSAPVVTMCMIMLPAAAARTHEHLSHAWLSFLTPGALGHPAQSFKSAPTHMWGPHAA